MDPIKIDPRDYIMLFDPMDSLFDAMRAIRKWRAARNMTMSYRVDSKELQAAINLSKYVDEL